MPKVKVISLLFLVLILNAGIPASAHNGPPFPIISDKQVGPCVISLWTHPDVGIGTFFVIVAPPPGGKIPSDLKIDLSVQPVSGRLAEVRYPTERGDMNGQEQFNASIPFDQQEMWRVRIFVSSSAGNGESMATVEVTPPGLGRWDLLLFTSPFLLVGFLWYLGMSRRRKMMQTVAQAEPKPQGN
jgi:hypothetical protein